MDSHFPEAEFFTEFEQFEAFVEDEKLAGRRLRLYRNLLSKLPSPATHEVRLEDNGISVICEKPLVLNASDLDALIAYEKVYGARVNSILQLRLHPSILALKDRSSVTRQMEKCLILI